MPAPAAAKGARAVTHNDRATDTVFRFHWRDGTVNEGPGRDVADAFTRLGFGRGASAALDYYERIEPAPAPDSKEGR